MAQYLAAQTPHHHHHACNGDVPCDDDVVRRLMEGFNQAIYGNAIRVLGGNIQIHAEGYRAKVDSNPLLPLADDSAAVKAALSNPEVIAATRRIVTGGMATNREGAFSLEIIGIEPEAEQPVSLIGNMSQTDAG